MTAFMPIDASADHSLAQGPDSFDIADRIAIPDAQRTPMQSATWLRACFDTLYPEDAPRLLSVQGGFGPFAKKGTLVPTLFLAGSEELAEPIAPPTEDIAAAQRLTDMILAERRPIRFGHTPADGPFAEVFAQRARTRGIVLSAPVPGSPYITLDESWTDPLARFSSRRRSDFRRMTKRAEAMGEVRYENLRPAPQEVPALLAAAAEVEARSWKARYGTAIVQNQAQTSFLNRYGQLAAAKGQMRIAFLHIGDKIAAMQIAVEYGRAIWLLKIGYDEAFSKASPGMLLMLDCVRQAAVDGLERVEFLGKAASWTEFWCDAERPNMSLRYYPRNPVGLAALARDSAKVAQGRLRQKWRNRAKAGAA